MALVLGACGSSSRVDDAAPVPEEIPIQPTPTAEAVPASDGSSTENQTDGWYEDHKARANPLSPSFKIPQDDAQTTYPLQMTLPTRRAVRAKAHANGE